MNSDACIMQCFYELARPRSFIVPRRRQHSCPQDARGFDLDLAGSVPAVIQERNKIAAELDAQFPRVAQHLAGVSKVCQQRKKPE